MSVIANLAPVTPAAPPATANRSTFMPFFEEQGKRPMVAADRVWFESGPGFYQSFPFHTIINDQSSLSEVFRNWRVLAARFPRMPSAPVPSSVLWVRRTPYSIDDLSGNARSKIRRGLKKTRVEQIDFSTLVSLGLPLVASTAARQRVRFGARQVGSWKRMCTAAARHPSLEAWAGFVGQDLAAFAVCFQVEDCYQISTVRSNSELLSAYPNNAVIHAALEAGFQKPGITMACYGLASLDRGTEGLNDFKRGAGFEAEPIDDVILGRLPILAARSSARVLDRFSTRSHRVAQLATVAHTMAWWRRDGAA
jgi:hypothetical protein